MFAELTKMIETLHPKGKGVVDNWIEEEINSELGFDAEEEILKALTGRVTIVQAIERLGVHWTTAPDQALNLASGPTQASWFPGGRP